MQKTCRYYELLHCGNDISGQAEDECLMKWVLLLTARVSLLHGNRQKLPESIYIWRGAVDPEAAQTIHSGFAGILVQESSVENHTLNYT